MVTATKLGTTNNFFVAATKNFAAATKRFVDSTKHFVDVTKYFYIPILTNRWSLKRAWYLTASGQDPGILPRHRQTILSRSLF